MTDKNQKSDDVSVEEDFYSGFVSLTGRPNVGKSTLLNQILDTKVSIVSDKAQTTRHDIRGVLSKDEFQIVFVDTPGISKPVTALGHQLNKSAYSAKSDVDVVCFVIDAHSGLGRGDKFIAQKLDPGKTVAVVNKIDGLKPEKVLQQLGELAEFNFSSYFPVSGWTGDGVAELVAHLGDRMPQGPRWYPQEMITDRDEAFKVAELVREQLLHVAEKELPHSIATRVTEWKWPVVKVEILVERESQKPIIIGKKGAVLKKVGSNVRKAMKPGAFLELKVVVKKNWQQSQSSIEELGY